MRCLLACLFCFAAIPAQTFVVDAANGPGTDFTDLDTAVNTVPSGAVLLVRAGQYGSFTISGKSLTVLGEVGVTMAAPAASVTVDGLAVGQRVLLRGLRTADSGGLTTFACLNVAGEIVLDQVGGAGFSESRFVATACAQVTINDCAFASNGSAAVITASDVTMNHCTLSSGHNAFPGVQLLQQPGLEASLSRVQLSGCEVAGRGSPFVPAPPAVLLQNAALRADGGSLLRADTGFQATFGLAIAGSGSARLTPDVTLAGAPPLVAATVSVLVVDLPAVLVSGGAFGGVSAATMTGGSGRLGVLWIGLPGPAVPFPSGDPLSIGNGVILAFAVMGAPLQANVVIPAQPTLVGAVLGWQGLTLDSLGGIELTNAWPFVLR
ncbi:MAG: hypothetical protein JNN13_08985 [Planctomycetes bacterium]|nr:hypothetical protein [Planctomycetota bacterium]